MALMRRTACAVWARLQVTFPQSRPPTRSTLGKSRPPSLTQPATQPVHPGKVQVTVLHSRPPGRSALGRSRPLGSYSHVYMCAPHTAHNDIVDACAPL